MSDKFATHLLDGDKFATHLLEGYDSGALDSAFVLDSVTRQMREEESRGVDKQILFEALRTAFKGSNVDALRDEVLMQVAGGEMRPSHAESLASAFGWEAFAAWADPASFDPMAEPLWALAMAAAWIRWHDIDRSGDAYLGDGADKEAIKRYWRERDKALVIERVRRHGPAYLAASRRWIETSEGYELGPREARGWSELPGEASGTKRLLCEALRDGQLKAVRFRDGVMVNIEPAEWTALKIVGFHDADGVHKIFAPDGVEYLAVHIRRDDVIAAF